MVIAMAPANAPKKIPGTPPKKTNGINTTSVVNVAPISGDIISLVALMTASVRAYPSSK